MKRFLLTTVAATVALALPAFAEEKLPIVVLSSGDEAYAASSVCVEYPDSCPLFEIEFDADRLKAARLQLPILDARNDFVKVDENVRLPAMTLVNTRYDIAVTVASVD